MPRMSWCPAQTEGGRAGPRPKRCRAPTLASGPSAASIRRHSYARHRAEAARIEALDPRTAAELPSFRTGPYLVSALLSPIDRLHEKCEAYSLTPILCDGLSIRRKEEAT